MEREALLKKDKLRQMEAQLQKNKSSNHKLYDTSFNFKDILKGSMNPGKKMAKKGSD